MKAKNRQILQKVCCNNYSVFKFAVSKFIKGHLFEYAYNFVLYPSEHTASVFCMISQLPKKTR